MKIGFIGMFYLFNINYIEKWTILQKPDAREFRAENLIPTFRKINGKFNRNRKVFVFPSHKHLQYI